jgi:hypothetical protein
MNSSIKAALAMYGAGIDELVADLDKQRAFLIKQAAAAEALFDDTDSPNIGSGFLPDDARDFNAAIEDLKNDMVDNLEDDKAKLMATTKAVKDKVTAADGKFQRTGNSLKAVAESGKV